MRSSSARRCVARAAAAAQAVRASREAIPRRSGDGVRQRSARDRGRRSRADATARAPPAATARAAEAAVATEAPSRIALASPARDAASRIADDRAEVSTSLFAEKRAGDKGGLTVVHPQADVGFDLGRYVTLDVGYSADAVTGATATVVSGRRGVRRRPTFSDLRHEGTLALGFQGRRSRLTFTGDVRHRARLPLAPGRRRRVDRPARPQHDRRARVQPQLRPGLRPRQRRRDAARAPRADRRRRVQQDRRLRSARTRRARRVWHDISIDTAQATLTQNLSPTMNLQVALYGQILERLPVEPVPPRAHRRQLAAGAHPRHARALVVHRAAQPLPAQAPRRGALRRAVLRRHLARGRRRRRARLLAVLGNALLLKFHARVYQQSAATFFKDAFFYETESTAGEYFTGDRELSPVRNGMVGAKLTLITVGERQAGLGPVRQARSSTSKATC